MMPLRIIVKDDRDSSIGRGGVLRREHFDPRMARLVEAVARATETLLPHAIVLFITEGWRPSIRPEGRDLHTELRAFDFTIEFIRRIRAIENEYELVARDARAIVGDAEYDFQVHGEGSNMHIHAEFDPK